MKKILLFLSLSGLLSLGGCADLDQTPFENFGENAAFKTPIDAQAWVDGMYGELRENIYGAMNVAPEYQADLFNVTIWNGKYKNIHRWDNLTTSEADIEYVWRNSYKAIANINKALIGFDNIPQQDEIKYNRGELHLARAFYYSYLATLFCKPYESSTQTEMGVPIVTSDSQKDIPSRGTLQSTYNFILDDLAKAEEYLKGKALEDDADSFTAYAAKALKARVLLYMQDWSNAYKVSSELIDSGVYPLASSKDELTKIWYEDNPKESIMQLYVANNQTEKIDGINLLGKLSATIYNPPVIPTKDFVGLYDTNDFRKEIFLAEKEVTQFSIDLKETVTLIHKYPGNPELQMGKNTNYEHKPKVFRIAEQYLIAAEAAYNNNDEANAIKYLDLLRAARGLTTPTTATGSNLLQEIKNERTRELAFEGFRLFDLKRWKQDIKRGTPQTMNFILKDVPAELYELNRSSSDYRTVWFLPNKDVSQEPEKLKQNPGW